MEIILLRLLRFSAAVLVNFFRHSFFSSFYFSHNFLLAALLALEIVVQNFLRASIKSQRQHQCCHLVETSCHFRGSTALRLHSCVPYTLNVFFLFFFHNFCATLPLLYGYNSWGDATQLATICFHRG